MRTIDWIFTSCFQKWNLQFTSLQIVSSVFSRYQTCSPSVKRYFLVQLGLNSVHIRVEKLRFSVAEMWVFGLSVGPFWQHSRVSWLCTFYHFLVQIEFRWYIIKILHKGHLAFSSKIRIVLNQINKIKQVNQEDEIIKNLSNPPRTTYSK